MFMLVPLNSDDVQEGQITDLEGCKHLCLLELEENGEVIETTFAKDVDSALASGLDYLVINGPTLENEDFFDYNVSVLQCMPNSTLEDILEGFLFRTLQEVL